MRLRTKSRDLHILIEHLAAHDLGLLSQHAHRAADIGESAILLLHEQLPEPSESAQSPKQSGTKASLTV